jgi:hypothetical protein
MTPKEKAENLVNNYRYILMAEDTDCGEEILCTTIAKRCALFAVDLILSEFYADDFYIEVKQEIKKI